MEGRTFFSAVPWVAAAAPNVAAPSGVISGFVFNDADGNSLRGGTEAGLSGWRVFVDDDGNGKLGPKERFADTNAAGRFQLTGLADGTYKLRVLPQTGWRQTTPQAGSALVVKVAAGKAVGNPLFGELRIAPSWAGFGRDAQHTAVSPYAAQALKAIHWHAAVDTSPAYNDQNELLLHYGSPVITGNNTVVLPVKSAAAGGFYLEARDGATGKLKWRQSTDYLLPPHFFVPTFGPTLTPSGRLVYAGAGGTVYFRDNPDGTGRGTTTQVAFYGLSKYRANPTAYNETVFVDTPITSDSAGNVYFGVQVSGDNPLHLKGGIVRVGADGSVKFISAADASGDVTIDKVAHDSAPALSNDGKLLYVAVNRTLGPGVGAGINAGNYLLALDSKTLSPVAKARLTDPVSGGDARVPDDGTASPTVGPDGDVYFGVLENPANSNHGRGWLLHFNGDLSQQKTMGGFGWDDTPSVVPASMVPGYQGTSGYLLLTKYNNYASNGGDGINKLAVLDPNAEQMDAITGACVMQEVLTIAGPTPDPEEAADHPGAVKEWCINTCAVDPSTFSVLANSEDGKLYRWDLRTNGFSQKITLTGGVGEGYTPTVIGPDGTVYAINKATLYAVGLKV